MTNEELIAKIKAEIESLKSIEYPCDNSQQATGFFNALDRMTDFLSTLEEQTKYKVSNPIFDECVAKVDPKVMEEVRENIDFEQALYDHFGQIKDFTLGMQIGKYFYELGCRRTAEKYDEIEYNRQREEEKPMNLEEVLKKEIEKKYDQTKWGYVDVVGSVVMDKGQFIRIARHFAKWGAEHLKK